MWQNLRTHLPNLPQIRSKWGLVRQQSVQEYFFPFAELAILSRVWTVLFVQCPAPPCPSPDLPKNISSTLCRGSLKHPGYTGVMYTRSTTSEMVHDIVALLRAVMVGHMPSSVEQKIMVWGLLSARLLWPLVCTPFEVVRRRVITLGGQGDHTQLPQGRVPPWIPHTL